MATLPRVWLLVGPSGCGKSESGRFLERLGYRWIEASQHLRGEVPSSLRFPERPVAVESFFARHGADAIASRVLATIREEPERETVVTGARLVEEVALFRRDARATVVALLSPSDLRYRRTVARGRDDTPLSYEEFLRASAWELSLGLARIIYEADLLIVNEGGLEGLHEELRRRVAGPDPVNA